MKAHDTLAAKVNRAIAIRENLPCCHPHYGFACALAIGALHPEYLAVLVQSFRRGFDDDADLARSGWVERIERLMQDFPIEAFAEEPGA